MYCKLNRLHWVMQMRFLVLQVRLAARPIKSNLTCNSRSRQQGVTQHGSKYNDTNVMQTKLKRIITCSPYQIPYLWARPLHPTIPICNIACLGEQTAVLQRKIKCRWPKAPRGTPSPAQGTTNSTDLCHCCSHPGNCLFSLHEAFPYLRIAHQLTSRIVLGLFSSFRWPTAYFCNLLV